VRTNEKPEAPYPGAPVLLICFARGEQTGQVKVQEYDAAQFRVGQFLPGVFEDLPGDSPKVQPEVHQWTSTIEEATTVFERYLESARAAGWEESR
jgi:hypothetical protein